MFIGAYIGYIEAMKSVVDDSKININLIKISVIFLSYLIYLVCKIYNLSPDFGVHCNDIQL